LRTGRRAPLGFMFIDRLKVTEPQKSELRLNIRNVINILVTIKQPSEPKNPYEKPQGHPSQGNSKSSYVPKKKLFRYISFPVEATRHILFAVVAFLKSHLGKAVKADSDETVTNYWRGVMNISRSARCNIAKDFSYIDGFEGGHFGDHKECVKNGIQYRWLVYEDNENLKDWEDYLNRLPKRLSEDQVQCRVIPVAGFGRIPWRITMFRGQITLCSPEPARKSYGKDKTTITFDDTATNAMLVSFDRLWNVCPEVEAAASMTPQERDKAIEAHDDLKEVFLQNFSWFYHKDVPIYRIEGTLAQMRDISRENRTLILFTAAVLAVNIALMILYILLRSS